MNNNNITVPFESFMNDIVESFQNSIPTDHIKYMTKDQQSKEYPLMEIFSNKKSKVLHLENEEKLQEEYRNLKDIITKQSINNNILHFNIIKQYSDFVKLVYESYFIPIAKNYESKKRKCKAVISFIPPVINATEICFMINDNAYMTRYIYYSSNDNIVLNILNRNNNTTTRMEFKLSELKENEVKLSYPKHAPLFSLLEKSIMQTISDHYYNIVGEILYIGFSQVKNIRYRWGDFLSEGIYRGELEDDDDEE